MSAVFSDDFKDWIRDIALKAWELIKSAAAWVWSRYARELVCFGIGLLAGLLIMSAHTDKAVNKVTARYEAEIAEIQAVEEKEATAGQIWSAEQEGYRDICRVLAGVKQYDLSDDAKKAICDVIVNRVNADYDVFSNDNTISEVCQHEGQFEGFKKDGSFSQSDFKLISDYLQSNAGRVLNSDKYFWIETHHGYIIAKDSFNGNGSQQKVS